MLVFADSKLVMLSVPKTGSTAYQEALAPHATMVVRAPPELKHAPVFRYNRFFRPMLERFVGGPLDIVAVMREPLDWLGSWYRYRARPEMHGHPNSTAGLSFDAFVEAYLVGQRPACAQVGSQVRFLAPQRNGTAVTHLFRYEDQPGLRAFLEARLGVAVTTPRTNESPVMPLRLSPGLGRRLRRKCVDEFRLHDGIGAQGNYRPLPPSSRPRPSGPAPTAGKT